MENNTDEIEMEAELRAWVALQRAEVPPRFADIVRSMGGARELIRRGELTDHTGKLHRFDCAAALADVGRWFRKWPWPFGRIVGGPRPETLGPWRDPPLLAYARGGTAVSLAAGALGPAVAIVGTRVPSRRGIEIAQRLARDVAAVGGTVVSGGAIGIDCAAHEAALKAGGKTVVVMGQPLKPANRFEKGRLGEVLAGAGAAERAMALFPWPPWQRIQKFVWSARNRFIAGLADAVVVVEGRERSGTRYTAEHARDFGIPLWAVVGDTEVSALPNELVDQGHARALNLLKAIEQLVPTCMPPPRPRPLPRPRQGPSQLTLGGGGGADAAPTLEAAIAAQGGRALVDHLAQALQKSAREVLVEATQLEIEGRLRREGSWLALVSA